jgi:glycosyltransferase involved in cell wall biosynthesis
VTLPVHGVAFAASKLAFGGAERVLVEQARAVAAWGVPVDVWVSSGTQFEHLAPELAAIRPAVREVAVVPGATRLAWRLIRRRPDVVVAYHAARAYRALLRLRRVPFAPRPVVVETVHERYAWALESFDGARPRAADAYLLTHDVRAAVRRAFGVDDARLFEARPLFPSSLLDPDDADRAEARRLRTAWGVPADAVVVGFLGRLGDNKGLLAAVDLVRRLALEGRDVHLVLAGRRCPELGDFDARLAATVASADASDPRCRGRFHLVGAVERRAPTYAAFDLLLLAARTEGLLPLMLVEGMSAGVPAVTTDVGGIASCLRDGVDAEVVATDPDDERDPTPHVVAALGARVRRLVDDPARRAALGAAGRARVRALVAANDFHGDTRRALGAALALGPAPAGGTRNRPGAA